MALFLAAVWLDTPVLFDAAIKSVVLLGLTALAVVAIWRASAAAKHLVWFLGTLGVLVLPLASALLPGWHFILPWQAAAQRQSAATERVAAAERPLPPPSPLQMNEAKPRVAVSHKSSAWPSGVAPAAPMSAAIEPPPAIAWRTLAARVWLAVSALILAYVVLSMISLWRLRRRSRPLADASWLALVDELRRQLGIGQPVNLLVSDARSMPMTWGVRRARLLLPENAATWTPELAHAVLLHELAHVKRRDCLTQLVAQLACALFWFNPLVWLARQGMQNEREQACDDLVLASGASAAAYAEQLLYVAAGMSLPRLAGGAIAMARPSKLKVRLTAILDTTRRRQLAGRTAVCFWLAAGFCTAVFAAVHVEDLSGDSALAAVSRWAAERGWQAQEVATADLTGSFGPAWRNLPFHISKEEEADTRACIELARKARSSVNGKTLFADPATRQALEEILQRRPEFFYAEFLLSTWHRDFGDPAESQRLLDAAYEHAPVILVQRFEFADGSPLVGGAVYGFTIECNRVENHWLDQINLEFLNLRTDANGCIYLPVYDTVFRRFSASTPYGYSVDFPTLGWCQTSRKVGLLPVATAATDAGSFVPAVPPSGPLVFGADLADGNSVELQAISGDGRDQPSGWWLPDGSPSPRDYQAANPDPDGWQTGRRRRFVLRFAKPLAEDAHRVLRSSAPSGFVRFGTVEGEDPRTTFSMFNSFPTNPRTISLRLGVAAGSGRTLGHYDPRTRTDSGDLPKGFRFSEIKELGTAATNDYRFRVLLLHPEVDEQLRLYAIDDQQQEHTTGGNSQMTGSSLPPGMVEDGFEFWRLPLDTMASFRLEARDYQWAEFDNIALAPRAAAPQAGHFTPARPLGRPTTSGVLADGGTIELVAISTVMVDPLEQWLPDGSRSPRVYPAPDPQWTPAPRPEQLRQFVFRFGRAPAKDTALHYEFSADTGTVLLFRGLANENDELLGGLVTDFPTMPRTVAIRFGQSVGAWESLVELDPKTDTVSGELPKGFSFSRVAQIGNDLQVVLARPAADRELRMLAIDARDHQHATEMQLERREGGGTLETVFRFKDVRLAEIAALHLESRPIQWVEFDNIPLAPAP